MLLKMLAETDFVIQECNQIYFYDDRFSITRELTDDAVRVYGECKVSNIYPRTDGVYGVVFEIESPN